MRTLIVEDDVTSQLLLQSFLSEYGECQIAGNGREAVEAFRAVQGSARKYDLICMDIMMPEVDGQTALREIRALEEAEGTLPIDKVKIIMTSTLNDAENVLESIKSSSNAYLVKPVHKRELLQHMKALHLI